jgi:transposase
MSNVLKVSKQTTISELHSKGWSLRRIARELGLNRRTVAAYAGRKAKPVCESSSKCTTEVTAGSAGKNPASLAIEVPPKSSPATSGKSLCRDHEAFITSRLEAGLTAERIHRELRNSLGFGGSYQSVKRFAAQIRDSQPQRVQRLESAPGEEAQIDFGQGPMVKDTHGKRRRTHILRVVLSFSRKGYSEAVFSQNTETFLRCLENAFRHFGGVPKVLNVDNLKAAVLRADWFDPDINPKFEAFCRHYGTSVMPCRPHTPEHKGKVERGIDYVKNSALKGHDFERLAAENAHLAHWEKTVADTRIHGTTKRQVASHFAQERPFLQPLPASLFPVFEEARRKVGRDSFVEVARAYYEVPAEHIGNDVWVRWDLRMVRILNLRTEPICSHRRLEPGTFSRTLGCAGMASTLTAAIEYWTNRAALLSPACGIWAQGLIHKRGHTALRSIIGLCALSKKHPAAAIDHACREAQQNGHTRLRDIQAFLQKPPRATQTQLPLQDARHANPHPILRDLRHYSDFIHQHTHNQ